MTPNRTTAAIAPRGRNVKSRKVNHMIAAINRHFIRFNLAREEGQAMAEYGLILALIALIVIAAVALIGTDLNTKFNQIANAL
jgi:pilus assembly protein Flp/PilA